MLTALEILSYDQYIFGSQPKSILATKAFICYDLYNSQLSCLIKA